MGLALVFVGERVVGHLELPRFLLSLGGLGVLLLMTALRLWTVSVTRGDRRRVEMVLLVCQAGALLALVLYAATTEWGQGLLGVDQLELEGIERYTTSMTVLWSIVMVVFLVPLFMIEVSLGTARRNTFSLEGMRKSTLSEESVEAFRVRESLSSGLSIALAAGFLMVTCNIADQRNVRVDLSYFKTSSPGSSTISIARNVSQPVTVLLFFPEINQTKTEVLGYFRALENAGGRLNIEEHDRFVSADLALKHRVRNEGTIVLIYDEKPELIELSVDPTRSRNLKVRTQLRELDESVNTALLKIVRDRRVAYMVTGHGEANDERSEWGRGGNQARQVRGILGTLNYEVKDLGIMQGLGNDVPDDADLVLLMAPQTDLSDEVLESLDRYLARGGQMFIALDPLGSQNLGPIEGRLGLRFIPQPITDDRSFLRQTRTVADRRIIVTNLLSSHASMTTLMRAGPSQGIILINSGYIEAIPFRDDVDAATRNYTIRAMESAFADINDSFGFDEGQEVRRQYNLAAAIAFGSDDSKGADDHDHGHDSAHRRDDDDRTAGDRAADDHAADDHAADDHAAGDHADGAHGEHSGEGDEGGDAATAGQSEQSSDEQSGEMRVVFFADIDVFLDSYQQAFPVLQVLFRDAVKWLGGEEALAGEILSEKDEPIVHTENEDILWFYATIVGAPMLVLAFGLWIGRSRRRGPRRTST